MSSFAHMQLQVGDRAYVHSMRQATDKNLQSCQLLRFDTERRRWKVRIDLFPGTFWIPETKLSARLQLQTSVMVMGTDGPIAHKGGNVWFLKQRCLENEVWVVSSKAGRIMLASASDLVPVFHIGARVLVLALDNEQLHRKAGKIMGQCGQTMQWKVDMQGAGEDHDNLVSVADTNLAPWPRQGDLVVIDTNDGDLYDGETVKIDKVYGAEHSLARLQCGERSLTRTIREFRTGAEDTHTVAAEAKKLLSEYLPTFHELMQILSTSTDGEYDVCRVAETLVSNTITAWKDEAFLQYAYEGRQCQYCCKMIDTSEPVLKCAKCAMAYYCDGECQRKDWTQCADTVGDHAGKHKMRCVSMNTIALPYRHRQSARTCNFLMQMLAVMNSNRLNDECGMPLNSRNDISDMLANFDAAGSLLFPCFDSGFVLFVPIPMWVYHRICTRRDVLLPADSRTDHVICAIMLMCEHTEGSFAVAGYVLRDSNVPT
jgi:hypothetical protein